MATLIYRCPTTALNVQGLVAEEVDDADVYVSVDCPACTRTHLINPRTGRVLGSNVDPDE